MAGVDGTQRAAAVAHWDQRARIASFAGSAYRTETKTGSHERNSMNWKE